MNRLIFIKSFFPWFSPSPVLMMPRNILPPDILLPLFLPPHPSPLHLPLLLQTPSHRGRALAARRGAEKTSDPKDGVIKKCRSFTRKTLRRVTGTLRETSLTYQAGPRSVSPVLTDASVDGTRCVWVQVAKDGG